MARIPSLQVFIEHGMRNVFLPWPITKSAGNDKTMWAKILVGAYAQRHSIAKILDNQGEEPCSLPQQAYRIEFRFSKQADVFHELVGQGCNSRKGLRDQ
jgi:hypothetical protein